MCQIVRKTKYSPAVVEHFHRLRVLLQASSCLLFCHLCSVKKTQPQEVSPALLAYLQGFLKDERKARFEEVLAGRTRHLTCVMENIADAHNANAVMRSCECFGIQDVHIIENGAKFKPAKKVLKGSHKWLSVHKYREEGHNTLRCLRLLKEKGYRIVATSLEAGCKPLHDVDVSTPLALVFGQEHIGISDVVKAEADEFVIVPMRGFTESLNIAAAAAILLQHFSHRLRDSDIAWALSEEEKDDLRKTWTLKNIYRNELLIERFYQDQL
jgi:tRNA (guanosine-2'-O-)-methyltransferase